jgi:hypothetical protein
MNAYVKQTNSEGLESMKYDLNNYNMQYHDTVEEIMKRQNAYDASFGSIIVRDSSGNLKSLPTTKVQGNFTYYTPGAYSYGATSYIPNYEDSVYLSRTSNFSK